MRCFIALTPPPSWEKRLHAAQAYLSREFKGSSIRWTTPAQWHVTLQFLGELTSDQMASIMDQLEHTQKPTRPIILSPGEWGAFPDKSKPRVLWLGLTGDLKALNSLQAQIVRQVSSEENGDAANPYQPHLTLGRVRRFAGMTHHHGPNWRNQPMRPGTLSWPASAFHLYQSELKPEGPVYTRLKTYSWEQA